MKNSKSVYEIVNERIFAEMEKGIIPWHKPWKNYDGSGNFIPPQNFITKKPYRGINFILLLDAFDEPYYLTFRQIQSLGGTLKKGSKSIPVTFWKPFTATEVNAKGETVETQKFFLRYYNVYNITQTEGIDFETSVVEPPQDNDFTPVEKSEKIIAGFKDIPKIDISKKGDLACYSPVTDKVTMPARERFLSPDEYYSTLFHELSHSTGHERRLSRKGITDLNYFGSHEYSKEELIAEFSASYLCSYSGIINRTVENTAAYIQNWFTALKKDPKLLVHGTSQGQKACEYILDTVS